MNKQEWNLKPESELRCEVSMQEVLTIHLLDGTAEIFGAELAKNKEYNFRGRNFAIYSWYGCKISTEVNLVSAQSGNSSSCVSTLYISADTPMIGYVNTHIQLEARRDIALSSGDRGPRVMVVGPPDHGKTTAAQIFCNYALRLDRKPIVVDLDVDQGLGTVPGCISAVPLAKHNLSIDNDYMNNTTPLVYFYGHSSPKENIEYYKHLVTVLAGRIRERLVNDHEANASGLIVDTSAWVAADNVDGIALLKHCIVALEIDIVLIMGSDKLHSALTTVLATDDAESSRNPGFSAKNSVVVKLPRSGGTVNRSVQMRREIRRRNLNEYFYGKTLVVNPNSATSAGTVSTTGLAAMGGVIGGASSSLTTCVLSPARLELKLSSLKILRVGGANLQLTEGMRAIGDTTAIADPMQVSAARLTMDLKNCLIALIHVDGLLPSGSHIIPESEWKRLVDNNVAGFLYVIDISPEYDSVVVMSPAPGASDLPSQYALVGSIKHMEQ